MFYKKIENSKAESLAEAERLKQLKAELEENDQRIKNIEKHESGGSHTKKPC